MEAIQSGSCAVHFGERADIALEAVLDSHDFSRVFVLTDTNTAEACLPAFLRDRPWAAGWHPLCIPAGETHKTLHTCLQVWKELSESGADRKSLLVNLGGGVVTDLGGFVASTYQRGIPFINIPTTLLAMVDASVGGKTGVDLGPLKNQIGVIRDPLLVLIQTSFLATLDSRQLRSGFAEMLKHGLILDRTYWESLKSLDLGGNLHTQIHRSILMKNEVVLADPQEMNLRKILNFGHTLGHAIESFYLETEKEESLLHGEAIAIGMILEGFLSMETCGLTRRECDDIRDTVLSFFPKVPIAGEHRDRIIDLLRYDKKNVHGKVLFSLLESIGRARYNVEVPGDTLQSAFDYYMD